MPGERLSMRKIRELLRLRWEQHLPQRVIANSLGLSQGSVSDYLSRARRADLTWPLPDTLDDAQLETRSRSGGRLPSPGAPARHARTS